MAPAGRALRPPRTLFLEQWRRGFGCHRAHLGEELAEPAIVVDPPGEELGLAFGKAPFGRQTGTVSATVSAVAPGAGIPTGTVTFALTPPVKGQSVSCAGGDTVTLRRGQATCLVPADLTGGASYSVQVGYGGDPNFLASTSGPVVFGVRTST